MGKKTILHADMDAFFASVEQVENPQYRNRPVIVGGIVGRGVVSAASYEAREFGVHSAMPMWQARQLCPQAVFLPGNGELYRRYSDQALQIYLSYTPRVEPLSIDEAYLDITGTQRLFGRPLEVATQIKQRIREQLGISISIGLGSNRLLAKMASDWDKPDGLKWIRDCRLPAVLDDLAVSRLWGIGEAIRKRLNHMGIATIGQLRRMPVILLEKEFGKLGLYLYRASRGQSSDEVSEYREGYTCKQVSEEMTLQEDSRDGHYLRLQLLSMAGNLARRLRGQRSLGRTVTLKLRFSSFKTITRGLSLKHPTDNWQTIYETAGKLLEKTDLGAQRVRLIGVAISSLSDGASPIQLNLFEDAPLQAHSLDRACDRIIERFGSGAITQARLLSE